MPRDANGNYTLPPGINPVIPGTDIEADWANPTLDDVAVALSDSLSRSGNGGMLAPFRFADGTSGSPSITWANQPQAGWYRAANNDFRYVINGIDILQLRPTPDGGAVIFVPLTLPGGAAATQNDAIAYAIALG